MIILIAGKNRIREGFFSCENEKGEFDTTNEVRYESGDYRLPADAEAQLLTLDKQLLDAKVAKTMKIQECDIAVRKAVEPYTK